MKPLYKYLKSEHVPDMLRYGVIRLGTVYEYRDVEKHGNAVGDAEEGKSRSSLRVGPGGVRLEADRPSPELAFFDGFYFPKGSAITLVGGSESVIVNVQDSPDLYIYCVTDVFDEAAMRKFRYDACVRIDRPRQFFEAIGRKLVKKKLAQPGGKVGNCIYGERERDHRSDKPGPAWLIKPPDLAYQREIRASWTPTAERVEPFILRCKGIVPHCSPFKIP